MNNNKLDGIIESILSLRPILYRNLIHPVLSGLAISTGTHYVLSTLERCGAISMSELSRKVTIPKPNLTPLIDRMIELDYVTRLNDEHDRRIVKVDLTETGMQKLEEIKEGIKNNIRMKLTRLSVNELNTLAEALDKVNTILLKVEDINN